MMSPLGTDICVLGGGPAGAIVAQGLARLGYDAIVVDRGTRWKHRRAESLAPSILPILTILGLVDAIDAIAFRREQHALIRWNTETAEERIFDPPSLLVDRVQFDGSLRDKASAAGARVLRANARAPVRLPAGGWHIPVAGPDGPHLISARFLVDARGRRRGAAKAPRVPRTAAMCGIWNRTSLPQTRIEAGQDEWFWGSPVAGDGYSATVFVEAVRAAGLSHHERAAFYKKLLSRSCLLSGLLAGELQGPPQVRDATPWLAETLVARDFIRVGEAAFAIDPLSSQGIQSAILSATQAVAAIHTILAGRDAVAAADFFRVAQARAAATSARHAARFYDERSRDELNPFWLQRAGS